MKKRYENEFNQNKSTAHRFHKVRNYVITIVAFIIFVLFLFLIGKQFLNLNIPSMQQNPLHATGLSTDNQIDLNDLNSPYAILIDMKTGNVMAKHNSEQHIYPASLTKIMTAIVAIEHLSDLNQSIKVPYDIFPKLYEEDASRAGFDPGENVKAKDLLYGVLLPSGAECCKTLEQVIAGSESKFVDMMNQKAKQLGLNNTHFSNSTGLHDKNHYSTVADIAKLLQYALKNKEFRKIFTSTHYSTKPSNTHPNGFTFYSTLYLHKNELPIKEGKILGGKTGYTGQAGLCLASLASINGKEYILVTAGAKGGPKTQPFHILDAVKVYNQIGNPKT